MNLGAIWFNKLNQQQSGNQMTPENWEDLMVGWKDGGALRNGAGGGDSAAVGRDNGATHGKLRQERGVLDHYEVGYPPDPPNAPPPREEWPRVIPWSL